MRRPTRQLTDAVTEAREVRLDGTLYYKSLRVLAGELKMPKFKIAVLSRIIRRVEGVSLAEENDIRGYFPDLEVLVDPIQPYDTRTHKVVKKAKKAPVKRRRRTSTNFDPGIFTRFREFREGILTNDEALDVLLNFWDHHHQAE